MSCMHIISWGGGGGGGGLTKVFAVQRHAVLEMLFGWNKLGAGFDVCQKSELSFLGNCISSTSASLCLFQLLQLAAVT